MSTDGLPPVVFGPFVLDRRRRRLTRAGLEVPLGGRAFDVLCALAAAGGEIVGKDALLQQVWRGLTVDDNNLQVQIASLRKALGDDLIATIPGRGYRLTMTPRDQVSPGRTVVGDKPSIAVLPFANMSGTIDQEYFADGIADDIITELARASSFYVIARTSSFAFRGHGSDVRHVAGELGVRYILVGTVRRNAKRLRVAAQLVDAETANALWADRYDRPMRDLFAVQDEIASHVASAIRPAVAAAELRRALRKPPESLGAWEAYQRGLWHLLNHRLEELPRARAFFLSAVEMDPTMSAGYTALAWLVLVSSGYFGLLPFEEAALLGAEQARKAVALNPYDADAHAALAFALSNQSDYQAASDHIQLALTASPSCAAAYQVRGMNLLFSEETSKARDDLTLAYRLDPRGVNTVTTIPVQIGISHYLDRNYAEAVEVLRRTIADNPSNPMAFRWLAAALGQLGRKDEAHEALNRAMTGWPDSFNRYTRKRAPWFRPHVFEHMLEGLRKAGWHPEK